MKSNSIKSETVRLVVVYTTHSSAASPCFLSGKPSTSRAARLRSPQKVLHPRSRNPLNLAFDLLSTDIFHERLETATIVCPCWVVTSIKARGNSPSSWRNVSMHHSACNEAASPGTCKEALASCSLRTATARCALGADANITAVARASSNNIITEENSISCCNCYTRAPGRVQSKLSGQWSPQSRHDQRILSRLPEIEDRGNIHRICSFGISNR